MFTALSALVIVVQALALARIAPRIRERYLAFVLGALMLRFGLAAMPSVSHPKLVVGLSINAAATLAVTAVGLVIVNGSLFRARVLVPFYLFLAVVLFSGVVNGEAGGLFATVSRFAYLLVLQLGLCAALARNDRQVVIGSLLVPFILPIGLQWASIVAGRHSYSEVVLEEWQSLETIGRSFIGSYGHESGFSMILLSMLVLLLFWRSRSGMVFLLATLSCAAGFGYANYRTAIMAAVPTFAGLLLTRSQDAVLPRQRRPASLILAGVLVAVLAVLATSERVRDRFAGLADVPAPSLLVSPPELTDAERGALSGRVYIWSRYLAAYGSGDLPRLLVGHGPEAWRQGFDRYAHNTFVSALYEFGALGLLALLVYWASLFRMALVACERSSVLRLLSAYAGFTILNCATMPLWQIEGVIVLALINGIAMHELAARARTEAASVRRPVLASDAVHGGRT